MQARSPYPGYRPFAVEESALFFGREEEVERLLERVLAERFVAVIDAPEYSKENGKSSLVRAGLIPALPHDWSWAVLRPGEDPARNLHAELSRSSALGQQVPKDGQELLDAGAAAVSRAVRAPFLIVVDQFDELFRYRHCRRLLDTARHDVKFVDLLLDLAEDPQTRIHVVVTMRREFLRSCAAYPRLSGALRTFEIAVLADSQLRRAVAEPLQKLGARVSSELAESVLRGLEPDRFPGHLPIVQHALRRAWDRQRGAAELGSDDWERLALGPNEPTDPRAQPWLASAPGDVLLRHAEEIHGDCTPAEREVVGELFRTVVAKVEGRFVRRPMSIGRIARLWQTDVGVVTRVVERFQQPGQTFLMPPSTGTLGPDTVVDISYDSFVWSLGSIWHHREMPLLHVPEIEEPAPPATAPGSLDRWAMLASTLLGLLLLAALLSSWLPKPAEVSGRPGDLHMTQGDIDAIRAAVGYELGDVHLTQGDMTRIRNLLSDLLPIGDVHLTEGDIQRIWRTVDLHLTEGDIERIRLAVAEPTAAGDLHLTGEHVEQLRQEAGDDFVDLHLTRDDIERIRVAVGAGANRLTDVDIERIRNVFLAAGCCRETPDSPPARSSTGPALQFSDLADARAGFIYELDERKRLELPTLGLVLTIEPCAQEAGERLRVERLSPAGETINVTSCFEDPLRQRRPDQEWTVADTCNATQFQDPQPPGFHYAIALNRDPSGRAYAIVRRCASDCRPKKEEVQCP